MHTGLALYLQMLEQSGFKRMWTLDSYFHPPIKVNPNKVYFVEYSQDFRIVLTRKAAALFGKRDQFVKFDTEPQR